MSFVPFIENLSNSTIWYEATAVYKSSNISVSLVETAGGGTTTGNVAAGAYSKTSFATALTTVLNAISYNHFTYTVNSDQTTYAQMPNTSPSQWGSSFTVTKTGAGVFQVTIS